MSNNNLLYITYIIVLLSIHFTYILFLHIYMNNNKKKPNLYLFLILFYLNAGHSHLQINAFINLFIPFLFNFVLIYDILLALIL